MTRATVFLIGIACVVAGCGLVTATPARHRPPLPAAEPIPALDVEHVVDELTADGFECWFDPGGDIASSWTCRLGDQDRGEFVDVAMRSGQTGPIESVSAYRHVGQEGDPIDAAALDELGASAFAQVLTLIVPEEHGPTDGELLAGIQANFPMELGGGWYLGFDRNSISRTMRLVYASDPQ